jgi:multiple sugar transport system substrate-binding protein
MRKIIFGTCMVRDSRRTRRRQFVKALGVGGSVLLAGCTGGSGDGGSSDGSGGSSDGGSSGDSSDGGSSGGDGSDDSSGGGSATQAKFVHISSFGGDAQNVVPAFNDQAEGVTIEATGTPSESTTTRNYYVNQFVSQSSDFDVGMMDVIWPAEFVANGWAAEVSDPEGHTENMLSTPVEAATIDGTLYGMPMFTDANALYYRSDKLEEYGYDGPPETYMELVSIAQDVLEQDDEITNGYIWQGGANEGLTIMWLNWLWGMGGSVRQDGQLKVNTQKGIDALQHAVDLIHEHEVTPESIPASGTDGNRQTFQQGGTLFMRNWPYAVSLFQDDTPVTGKFDVAKMPKAEGNPDANNSCLGGWSIFVNAFSENKEAAQQFATYMASMEAQETLALEGSRLPVREELYADEYFEQAPNLETFAEVLQETRARPATPKYPTFSEIVYTEANKALVQSKTPEKALNDAQSQIDSQVNNA